MQQISPPTYPQLSELEFRRFQKLIFEAAGIHLTGNKRKMVEGRLLKRLKTLSVADFSSYFRYIETQPSEYQQVVDLLTTNETCFFREIKHFDFLKNKILPRIPRQPPYMVWSAACSSGEEPYSIAMVLAEHFGFQGWKVVASDISTQVLERARRGHYPMNRGEPIPREYLRRYCLRGIGSESGTFLVDNPLRQNVEFNQINLMNPLRDLPQFDLIWLRNVLIYFSHTTKSEVVNRVTGALKPGGYLFIGHADSLSGLSSPLEQCAPAIYRNPLHR